MNVKQDETFVTVTKLDVNAEGLYRQQGNDWGMFDLANVDGAKPIGPEPDSGHPTPAIESDGELGTGKDLGR